MAMTSEDEVLVRDFMRVRFLLNNGRVGKQASRKPRESELRDYGRHLKAELDSFVHGELTQCHSVAILHDDHSALVRITLAENEEGLERVDLLQAGNREALALEGLRKRLRETRSQWVYFDRNLRVYGGDSTYIMKPMQRFHWTETQARIDARHVVSESIGRARD